MKKIFIWLDYHLEEILLCILLAVIACLLFLQIVLRISTSNTLSWPEEIARYCFVYIAFFCIPMCIRDNRMLKVDIIVGLFPEKIKKYLMYLGDFLCLIVWCYLFYFSWSVLTNALNRPTYSQTLGYNMVLLYGMPFFALALAVFRGIQRIIRESHRLWGKKPENDSAEGSDR